MAQSPTGAATESAALETFQSPIIKDYELMLEYKQLKTSAPSGVYVVPSFSHLRLWTGFIIVHQGWYKGGVFKFRVKIPQSYPDGGPPTVQFLSKVYHPFVHQRTLNLHLGWAIKRWTPGKHSILYVLKRLKKMFYITDFSKYPAVWPIAQKLSQTDRSSFLLKVRQSVKLSLSPENLFASGLDAGDTGANAGVIKFSPPHKAHSVFFENYCKSRGIKSPDESSVASASSSKPSSELQPRLPSTVTSDDLDQAIPARGGGGGGGDEGVTSDDLDQAIPARGGGGGGGGGDEGAKGQDETHKSQDTAPVTTS